MELDDLRRAAAFRRGRELAAERRLRESDALLDLVEQCRLRDFALVPTSVWARVVRFVRDVDPALRDELGIDRRPDHVSDVMFAAQEVVLRQRVEERRPRMADIIPLFPDASDDLAPAL